MVSSEKVLVIGGSSGIGSAVATLCLQAGYEVIIAGSSKDKVRAAIDNLKTGDVKVSGRPCDLSNTATLDQEVVALLAFANEGGPITHIVHTAGEFFRPDSLADFDPATAFNNWTVRYLSLLTLAKHIPSTVRSMTFTSGGRVNKGRSTIIGIVGAVEAITKSLAVDIAPVRVNCVSVGTINTAMTAQMAVNPVVQERIAKATENQPIKGLGDPADVAQAYLYFIKDNYQTGSILTTDGGRNLM